MLWSLFLGAKQVGKRRSLFSRTEDLTLQRITADHFPKGYTIVEAKGGWYDAATKRFVREDSRQIYVTADSEAAVDRWAKDLGATLKQKELMVVRVGRQKRVRVR